MRLDNVGASARMAAAKLRRALDDGTLAIKLRRRVRNVFGVPMWALTTQRRFSRADRALDLRTGFADHRASGQALTCSDAAILRLAEAFRRADADWAKAPPSLEVRGLWSEWLDFHYADLRVALLSADVTKLRSLFENMHRSHMTIGVGGTIDDVGTAARWIAPTYYRSLWLTFATSLRETLNGAMPIDSPCVGNPHGVWMGDRLVQLDTIRHAFYATELLRTLGAGEGDRLDVLEIGGGLGGQAVQFLALGNGSVGSYTIIDLPEVGALAGYVLMAVLGEREVRLYGEPEGSAAHVTVLPPWEVDALRDDSFDLAFNANSFSEMDGRTAAHYLGEIERVCRRLIFHINHETRFRFRQPDGSVSVNRLGSELVPRSDRFQLRDRHVRRFVRPEQRVNVGFEYLYERTPIRTCATP